MSGPALQILLVGAGGFVGSALRYGLSGFVHRLVPFSTFPYGTLVVNLAGCLVLGWLTGLLESRQLIGPELRLFLFIGLLGGFTTFSTFGYETFEMMRSGEHLRVAGNVLSHVFVGIGAVLLGHFIASLH